MFRSVNDFVKVYRHNADEALRLLSGLTDASLSTAAVPGHRTAGAVAWHIVQSIPGMSNEVGLGLDTAVLEEPIPASAARIIEAYGQLSAALLDAISSQWSDATLEQTDNMYGETWARGTTLLALYAHETHHFGQLTVLMRLAGLPVYGRFGPSKEEWVQFGMEQPPGA